MSDITLYTTPTCGFCRAAKMLLEARSLPYDEVDVARDPELRQRLSQENHGYRTVPMIFIDGQFIGGFTELQDLDKAGRLKQK